MMLKILNKNDNYDDLINNELVLVDFFAEWCGPCKMLIPNLEKLSEEFEVIKVNVDEFPELARRYGIMSIPTLYVFKKGELVSKKIGYLEFDQLNEWMKSLK